MKNVAILLLFLSGFELASTNDEELISLYNENDPVIELTDKNFTSSIHDPDVAWFVEFYAHWCGHCQRFSPTWKQLAKEFDDPLWSENFKFGAINCAQNSICGNYSILGTPTLRLFYGGQSFANQGIDVMATMDADELLRLILQQIEIAQSYGYLQMAGKLPNFSLVSGLKTTPPMNKKMIAYVVEEENRGYLGRDIVFHASKQHPQLQVHRLDWLYARNSIFQTRNLPMPTLLLVPVTRGQLDWNQMKVMSPSPLRPTFANYRKEMLKFTSAVMNEFIWAENNPLSEPTTTTTTMTSTSTMWTTTTKRSPAAHSDEVYMADLEKAIQYILEQEVPTQENLDELRLKAVNQLLENMIRYLPLRKPIRDFLIVLRDWPSVMEIKAVTGASYGDKVEELEQIYRPFAATPKDWIGCKGSEPKFRGYPCSLWRIFHTMMVNAAVKGDPSMALGGASSVARSMVNYIYYFFSCRHCAENFRHKVNSLGFLPATSRDSILWLWQIHNMANKNLKGDPTEDPSHPKITWPSELDCPRCRSDRLMLLHRDPQIALIRGQLWNLTELVEHNIKVYGADQLIPVDPWLHFEERRKIALKDLQTRLLDIDAEDSEKLASAVDDFCTSSATNAATANQFP